MGGSTQQNTNTTQYQTQSTQPWAPAAGALQGILANTQAINPGLTGRENEAISRLYGLGAQGNPFLSQLSDAARSLLGSANMPLNPYDTPGFREAIGTLGSDITNQINGQFAAAGRDLSGMNTQTLARGLAQGIAPTIASQYNENVNNRLKGILGGIEGANAAASAGLQGPLVMLQAEAQRRGIPLQTLAAQMGIVLPPAQAFGTTSGTNVGNATTTTQLPLTQQIVGGAIGGAGLLGNLGWKPFA